MQIDSHFDLHVQSSVKRTLLWSLMSRLLINSLFWGSPANPCVRPGTDNRPWRKNTRPLTYHQLCLARLSATWRTGKSVLCGRCTAPLIDRDSQLTHMATASIHFRSINNPRHFSSETSPPSLLLSFPALGSLSLWKVFFHEAAEEEGSWDELLALTEKEPSRREGWMKRATGAGCAGRGRKSQPLLVNDL